MAQGLVCVPQTAIIGGGIIGLQKRYEELGVQFMTDSELACAHREPHSNNDELSAVDIHVHQPAIR